MKPIIYGGDKDDTLKLWRVWFGSDGIYDDGWNVEGHDIEEATIAAKALDRGAIVKIDFDLCLHDNDWWDGQQGWLDCPYDRWS